MIPYFPFKKIERFYDIQGLLNHPELFAAMCDVMAARYATLGITKIVGFEVNSCAGHSYLWHPHWLPRDSQARGFLFTPVALTLKVPFVMLRKAGKMPNTISSTPYTKEYAGVDVMCIQRGAVTSEDKVAHPSAHLAQKSACHHCRTHVEIVPRPGVTNAASPTFAGFTRSF